MRSEQKSETTLTKDNRLYFRKLPSKSRLSHSIIEIIADKDKRFLQKKVHKMSAILIELLRHESNIIEPKTTQDLKENYQKYA